MHSMESDKRITDIGCKSFIKRQNVTFKDWVRTVFKNLLFWFMMGEKLESVSITAYREREIFMAVVAS